MYKSILLSYYCVVFFNLSFFYSKPGRIRIEAYKTISISYKELIAEKTVINYMWERFMATWFSEETTSIVKEIAPVQKVILERSFIENIVSISNF